MSAAGAWKRVLDELDRDLQRTAAALRAGDVPRLRDWAPPDLGPLPDELWPRAERLAAEIERLEGAIRARVEGLRGELDDLGRRRAASAAYHRTDHTA